MFSRLVCLAFFMTGQLTSAWASQAIAVWAFPDRALVMGTVHIGVVAYHAAGVNRVEFAVDSGAVVSVTSETVNPATGEYEFVFDLNTTTLTDTNHAITARAYPATGEPRLLPVTIIEVVNHKHFNTWYVDTINGNNTTGTGSSSQPLAGMRAALNRATGGDTVKLRTGAYTFPDNWTTAFNKYVTIMPDQGAQAVITASGGTMRKGFLKVVGLTYDFSRAATGVDIHNNYSVPYFWFDRCTFLGVGKENYNNGQGAFRVYYSGGSYTIENCTVQGTARGFVVGGAGRNIIRNCEVVDLSSDAFNPGGEMLITGNHIHGIAAPKFYLENTIPGPADVSVNQDFTIHYCEWNSCAETAYVPLNIPDVGAQAASPAAATLDEVAAAFNAVPGFYEKCWAEVRNERLRLYARRSNYVQHMWVSGAAAGALAFAETSFALEKSGAGAHSDIIQFWGSTTATDTFRNLVFRNNRSHDNHSQGIFPGADLHNINVAFVNNLVEAVGKGGWNVSFAGGKGTERFENALFEHNTIWDQGQWMLIANDSTSTDMTFRNNIFGRRTGRADIMDAPGFTMDYNCYVSFWNTQPVGNTHSLVIKTTATVIPDSLFADVRYDSTLDDDYGDYRLAANSRCRNRGTAASGITYDLTWNPRDAQPDLGAYEYAVIGIAAGSPAPGARQSLEVKILPNPACLGVAITVPVWYAGTVTVSTLTGRPVAVLPVQQSKAVWPGTDMSGRSMPQGVYLVRAGEQVRRVMLVR
jgi:parallel beta-helix repeat protein